VPAPPGDAAPRPHLFGRFLVERGVIDEDALCEALDLMRTVNTSLGRLAADCGLITEHEADEAGALQADVDGQWGEIALALGLGNLTFERLERLRDEQEAGNLRLSDALVELGHVSCTEVETLWSAYERERDASDPLASLPTSLAGDPAARAIVEAFPRLARRILGLPARVGPARTWNATEAGAGLTLRLGRRRPLSFGLRLRAVDVDDISAVARFVQVLGEHAMRCAAAHDADDAAAVQAATAGPLPGRGIGFDFVIGDLEGAFVLAPSEPSAPA
jgi:hypothetical protein